MSHVEPVPHMLNALQHLCIPHLLQDQATRIPNAPAILAPGRTPLTYWRLHRQVDDTVETILSDSVATTGLLLCYPMGQRWLSPCLP